MVGPQPTALPQARGLDEYVQGSSTSDPRYSNYINTGSTNSSSNQLNAYGVPLNQGSVLGYTTAPVVKTNTYTGQFTPEPGPAPAPKPDNSGSFDRFDKNANPGDGWGWHGSDGGWKPEGGGSGGGGVDTRALEDAYGRLQGLFGEQETTARGTAASADKSILDNYGSSIAKTEAEKAKMLRDIQLNKQRFDEAGFGALDQNARDYSALEQRANVRYGGGSGVGDLMRELAAKEFYRSQGGVRKQQLAGEQDFANQMSDTELFIGEKLGDLDLWKNDAMAEVKNRLTTQLNQISSMRAESEIAKEERKLAALQTAQENARRITEADNQFKSNLLTQYMASKSEIMGRALTPQEIQSIIPQFMGPGLNPSGSTEAGPAFRTFGNEEDELTALNAVNQQLPA